MKRCLMLLLALVLLSLPGLAQDEEEVSLFSPGSAATAPAR
jgi:hypothetical protein